MATKYATAKEAIDAKNAINTPSPTPTTPVTPTASAPIASPTTPTPTVPTPPRVEGQWNYGTADNQVLGEKPTVAPTQPTPTVKPSTAKEAIAQGFKQEIKPVATGANAPLTTEIGREAKLGQLPNVQVAQNQAEQEQINTQNLKSSSGQQLWSNLDTISKNNPSLLSSRDAYDKAFGYQGKDAGEKALVDAFWNAKKNDSNAIYNSLATGQKLPVGIKGPALDDAIVRHQDITRFENLNPYQLSKVINSELIPGTQTYNDLMAKNPQLVTDAMKLASINTPVTARQETKTNWQDTLSAYLSRSPVMSNPTTVATIMNSDPNIATKTNEVQAVEDKLTEAKDRLKNIQKNVTERYKGTGATKQTINAKVLAESQDIIDEITMLEANKASASSALTTLIQNAKDNYAYARQDRQDALDQYNKGFAQLQAMVEMGMRQDAQEYQKQKDAVERDLQLLQYYTNIDQANAKEARGYNFQTQQDLRNFEQQKELAKMGYQNQYNLANLGFNQDMAKLGATQAFTSGQNATAQQNEMIKAAMTQGLSYEDAKARVMGTAGQQTNVGDYIKSKEGFRDTAYLDSAGVPTIGYGFTSVNGRPVKMGDTMDRATADAEFNNQIQKYQTFQNLVTVPLSESQKAALTSFEYNLGSGIWKKNAMPIITAINNGDLAKAGQLMQQYNQAGGKFVQGLANRRAEEAQLLQQAQTTPNAPAAQPTGYQINGKSFNESDVEVLAEIRDVFTKNATEGKKLLKENGYDVKDIAALNNNKLPKTGAQKASAVSTMQQIKDLASMEWNDAVGRYDIGRLGQDGADAREKIETIASLVTMPNLGMLKGPMTDKDLAFVKSAGSTLSVEQSNKAFEKNMVQLYNIAARTAGLKEVEKMDEIAKQDIKAAQNNQTGGGAISAPVDNRFAELYSQLQ